MRQLKRYYSSAQYRTILATKDNRTCGVPDKAELIISESEMRTAEHRFWKERGFKFPPGITCGGVMR